MTPEALLNDWLQARLAPPAGAWLSGTAASVRSSGKDGDLYLAFSLVPRKCGKGVLGLGPAELAAAGTARPGWKPASLTIDQAARIYLLLAAGGDADAFCRRLDQLCATADVAELVVLYRGLPLYPYAERHRLRAAEGVRTNMRSVFEAVAHDNPYPAEQLDEGPWNQLVLKALFVGSTLDPIAGLDGRANAALARMLCDYAHERWSADRPVSPELWRCVGPFATGSMLDDLRRALEQGDTRQKEAAALALSRSPDPAAGALLRSYPSLAERVSDGSISWRSIAATV